MANTNAAAWVDAKGQNIRVGPAEKYKPGKDEVLIEVHYVAVNPVDAYIQKFGVIMQWWPCILGDDCAGVVVETGEEVTHVSIGARVLASMNNTEGLKRSAFQKYAIAPSAYVTPIPEEMSFRDACVIPLALLTSAAGLYMPDQLALPLPSTNVTKTDKTVLIWGGATSVACIGIQLAVASGIEVVTTASPRNFELCRRLGASEVFDYNSETVVEDVTSVLKGRNVAGVFEASGMDDAMEKSVKILSALGGGYMAPVRPANLSLPDNVKATWVEAANYIQKDEKAVRYIWQDFLPAALKSGQLKSAPQAEVVGKGLEAIQDGLDAWWKGVSAKKIVIEI